MLTLSRRIANTVLGAARDTGIRLPPAREIAAELHWGLEQVAPD